MKSRILRISGIIIAIIVGILVLLFIWYYMIGINIYIPWIETRFYKVYDTGFYEPGYEYIEEQGDNYYRNCIELRNKYCESYIIVNAPDNIDDLKNVITTYEKKIGYIEKEYNKCDLYERRYIKESRNMRRNWKPDFFDATEENHYFDIVCRSTYSKYKYKTVYNIRLLDYNFKEIERKQFIE